MLDYAALHSEISALREKQVFFIGGAAKSGTTWLQVLLDNHPAISCNGEGHFPTYLIPRVIGAIDEYNQDIDWKNQTVFGELPGYPQLREDQIGYLWASAIALQLTAQMREPAIRLIGEKTPDNVRFFALLKSAFPAAKFIHIVRDGRDCAVSGWFHNLRVSPDWTRETFTSMDAYVRALAAEWAGNVGAGSRFGEANPDSYLALRYEDLAADPIRELARVLAFLGAESGPDILETCLGAASFERLSGGRARGDENRDSLFRKGTSGDWRQHFTAETTRIFTEQAGEWLARYGYD
ncbi:MAG: sulfotransferase [Aliidongia sp.]